MRNESYTESEKRGEIDAGKGQDDELKGRREALRGKSKRTNEKRAQGWRRSDCVNKLVKQWAQIRDPTWGSPSFSILSGDVFWLANHRRVNTRRVNLYTYSIPRCIPMFSQILEGAPRNLGTAPCRWFVAPSMHAFTYLRYHDNLFSTRVPKQPSEHRVDTPMRSSLYTYILQYPNRKSTYGHFVSMVDTNLAAGKGRERVPWFSCDLEISASSFFIRYRHVWGSLRRELFIRCLIYLRLNFLFSFIIVFSQTAARTVESLGMFSKTKDLCQSVDWDFRRDCSNLESDELFVFVEREYWMKAAAPCSVIEYYGTSIVERVCVRLSREHWKRDTSKGKNERFYE